MLSNIFILLTSLTLTLGDPDGPIVNTDSGLIQGVVDHSTGGRPFYGYRAIPYAQAPVGQYRFKPPRPFGQWTGIRDGSQLGPICPQVVPLVGSFGGDEDCLVLNVYVPQYPGWPQRRLPVLFWIHGGGFTFGSGRYDGYGPQNHMDFDVVLVTINYRLGALGFLGTNDSNAYGNNGMLDQVMALQWVQKNIENFGGDPDQVTIFGESAGGFAVTYLLLSRLSFYIGLFSKGISQSGVETQCFQPNPLQNAKSLALEFNCSVDNSTAIVECLRQQSAQAMTSNSNPFLPIIWAPVAEPPGGPGFLTEDPLTLLKSGRIANKVPLLIGHNAMEGYLTFILLQRTFQYTGSAYFANQFPSQLPLFTNVQPYMTDAIQAIADHYYSNNPDLDNPAVFTDVLSQIISDRSFDVEIARSAGLYSQAGLPVYGYIYDYKAEICYVGLIGRTCGIYTAHADEVLLQFRVLSPTQPLNTNDAQMSKILNSLWVEFASKPLVKFSNGQKWPRYNNTNPRYVRLNLSPAINEGPLSNQTAFWLGTIDGIVQRYS